MRKLMTIGFAFGLALAPVALNAQGGAVGARRGGPVLAARAMNPAEGVLAHREELGLTAAQVSQLERIRDRVKAQNEPLLEQLAAARPQLGRGSRPGMVRPGMAMLRRHAARVSPERRAELRDTARARLQSRREQLSQLTPDQRAQLRDSVRARMQARRPGMALLSPEQRAQARDTIRSLMQSRREELRSMTPEQRAELQKQHQARASELRNQAAQLRPVANQLRENMTASRKEVESVLTSEQLARLQSLRGRGRGGAPPR
jgi:Spy/CpxP family protein refolding chaperone